MAKSNSQVSEARDNSVLFALGELSQLEEARMRDEADAKEAKRMREAHALAQAVAEAEATAARAEADAKLAERVAEAEARLRVEAQRDDAGRMASMRDEIARIREERELLHRTLAARSAAPQTEGVSSKRWALAFGTSSLVAASLAAMLVFQARTTPTSMPSPVIATQPTVAAIAPANAPLPVPTAAARVVEETPIEVALPTPTRRGGRPTRTRPETHTEVAPTSEFHLDLDSDDVLAGINEEHPRRAPRRAH